MQKRLLIFLLPLLLVVSLSFTSATISNSDLSAHFKFNNNVNDEKNYLTSIAYGNPIYVSGKDGQALSFDGDDYLEKVSTSSSTLLSKSQGAFSIWVKFDSSTIQDSSLRSIIGIGSTEGSNDYIVLYKTGTKVLSLQYRISGNPHSTYTTQSQYQNYNWANWNHIVGVWDESKKLHIYINGQKLLTQAHQSVGSTPIFNLFRIGRYPSSTLGHYFKGSIDDVKVFNRAITDSEVLELYNSYSSSQGNEPSNPTPSQSCGNGVKEGTEVCETTQSRSCSSNSQQGSQTCKSDCTGWNTCAVTDAPRTYSCSDSDSGENTAIKGTASNSLSQSGTDVCTSDSKSVIEYYCASDLTVKSKTIACPTGQTCSDGACKDQAITPTKEVNSCPSLSTETLKQIQDIEKNNKITRLELSSENPTATIEENKVELISTSNSAATIKLTSIYGTSSETKEIDEGTSKMVNGLYVTVDSADESNTKLKASLSIGKKAIIKKEGQKIHKNNFFLLPYEGGSVFQVKRISNISISYTNDLIEIIDVVSGQIYKPGIVSEGKAILDYKDRKYFILYEDDLSKELDNNIIITWGDGSSFGIPGEETETFFCGPYTPPPRNNICQDLMQKVKFPAQNLIINDEVYRYSYNHSTQHDIFIKGNRYKVMNYYASWSRYNSEKQTYNHISYDLISIDAPSEIIKEHFKNELDGGACVFNSGDDESRIYVCNWDAVYKELYPGDLPSNTNDNKLVAWFNDNVIVRLNIYQSRQLTDSEQAKIANNRFNTFVNSLKNNAPRAVDYNYFNIDYQFYDELRLSLKQCPSDVQGPTNDKGEECYPYWECKTEPVVCPEHGYQTRVCIDNSCGGKTETREFCSPGICSGCYIPRWSGARDNICIPYGTRLLFEDGDNFKVYENEVNREDWMDVVINNDKSAKITLEQDLTREFSALYVNSEKISLSVGSSFTIHSGLTYNIVIESLRGNSEEYDLRINNIVYSENSDERYFDFTLNKNYPSYCNYNGEVLSQKTKYPDGTWASCQNSYECASNLCSNGECVEIKDAIREAGRIRGLAIRVLCRLANVFSEEKYGQCIGEYLGY